MPEQELEPLFKSDGCECCGEDRPWTMVVDSCGNAVALCDECIEMLTPHWWSWVGTEPFDA